MKRLTMFVVLASVAAAAVALLFKQRSAPAPVEPDGSWEPADTPS